MSKSIEIACSNFISCRNAEKGGATRIELFENLADGGCTPSYGTMRLAKEKISLPIYAMIRPRGGDFCYSKDEFESMKLDIQICKEIGIDGIVFGILDVKRRVDMTRSEELMNLWQGKATFHRAIDMSENIFQSTENIIQLGFERILTSGGKSTAIDGFSTILELNRQYGHKISVMAGSGITAENVHLFYELKEIHATCKSEMPSNELFGKYIVSDEDKIRELRVVYYRKN